MTLKNRLFVGAIVTYALSVPLMMAHHGDLLAAIVMISGLALTAPYELATKSAS